jgi:hypothetical protein
MRLSKTKETTGSQKLPDLVDGLLDSWLHMVKSSYYDDDIEGLGRKAGPEDRRLNGLRLWPSASEKSHLFGGNVEPGHAGTVFEEVTRCGSGAAESLENSTTFERYIAR